MKKLLFLPLLFVATIASSKPHYDVEKDLLQKTEEDVKKLIEELDNHIYEDVGNFDKNLKNEG